MRDAARALVSAFPKTAPGAEADAGATQAKGWAQEVFATAERMAAASEFDVLWVSERELRHGDEVRFGRAVCHFLTEATPA